MTAPTPQITATDVDRIVPRSRRRRLALVLAVVVCGGALSLSLYGVTAARERQLAAAQFKLDAEQHTWGPAGMLWAGLAVTGLLVGYLALLTGRTERVQQLVAERTAALRESEQRFRRLVENAGDAFFLHDSQGRFLDVNQRACDALGYTREELLKMTVAEVDVLFTPHDIQRYWGRLDEDSPITFEGVHRRKDGGTFPVEIRLAVLYSGGQRLMLGLARDITDRKRAEEVLRGEQRLLRELLNLQERDRELVAYEIHDGLAQQLTAAVYTFQTVERLRDEDPRAANATFDEAMELLRKSMAETRRLIGGLRPPILDESGVVAAIDYLVCEQRQRGGPEIEFDHHVEFDRLAAPLEIAVFRIVQECLTNACRYSQSQKVLVELGQAAGRVLIRVQDWGIGFDPAQVRGEHFGLRGIRERARLLGGSATVEAAPAKGTRVIVELPLLTPQTENGTVTLPRAETLA